MEEYGLKFGFVETLPLGLGVLELAKSSLAAASGLGAPAFAYDLKGLRKRVFDGVGVVGAFVLWLLVREVLRGVRGLARGVG